MTDLAATPRAHEADPVRDALVAAAAEVFSEHGYDRSGVQEIARRAGLTTGAIYNRFTGKADLLNEAIEQTSRDELEKLFATHDFTGHASDIVLEVGAHLATRSLEPGEALLFEAVVAARRDEDVAEIIRHRLADRAERFAQVIEAAKLDGSLDPAVDTAAVVRFAHTVAMGFLMFDVLGVERPDPDAWADLIARLVQALAADTTPGTRPTPTETDGTASADSAD